VQTDVTTIAPRVSVARPRKSAWETRIIIVTVLVLGIALSAVVLLALHSSLPRQSVVGTATTLPPNKKSPPPYLVGTPSHADPSGMAPPGLTSMKQYLRTYVADFPGTLLPAGWVDFTGIPGGDAQGQFAATHVQVAHGMLQLHAWQDPKYHNKWTTGGLCQCGHALTYGAFFVRSRITGPGPNEVELLWPASNTWPPEVDFNETGNVDSSTSWTIHFGGAQDDTFQRTLHGVDMTKWHTWGVIWTPRSLTFTVDGQPWGTYTNPAAIPHVPMTLDLQQRPACAVGPSCPAAKQSLLIDWVAEYQHV
jgi:hypothetical protein